jgi:hypothetical protein
MLLPKQIIALKKIVSRTAGRFGFPTVRIERHERGPRAMATDGRRAVLFQWDEPEADKFPAVEGLSPKPVRKFAANVPPNVLADAGRGIPSRTPRGRGYRQGKWGICPDDWAQRTVHNFIFYRWLNCL